MHALLQDFVLENDARSEANVDNQDAKIMLSFKNLGESKHSSKIRRRLPPGERSARRSCRSACTRTCNGVWGLGLRVWGLGFGVKGVGCRVQGLKCRV